MVYRAHINLYNYYEYMSENLKVREFDILYFICVLSV